MIIDIKNHIPKDPQGALALRCPDLVILGPNVVENDQPVGTGIFNMGCGDAGMPVPQASRVDTFCLGQPCDL